MSVVHSGPAKRLGNKDVYSSDILKDYPEDYHEDIVESIKDEAIRQ